MTDPQLCNWAIKPFGLWNKIHKGSVYEALPFRKPFPVQDKGSIGQSGAPLPLTTFPNWAWLGLLSVRPTFFAPSHWHFWH